jgi:CheY-like chemotaxis protein
VADRRSASETDSERLAQVSGALHDVSNALTVVLGWVDEARTPDLSQKELLSALRMIEQHARKARDLARVAIGAEVPPPSSTLRSVDAVVDEVLAALSPAAREAGVVVVVEGRLDDAACHDPTALHHVLVNLVLNAVAHSPRDKQAHIRVRVSSAGEGVLVDVVDEGRGVPDPLASSIFSGASTRKGGAGVGLAHSRSVARTAGGDLRLVPQADALSAHGASVGAVFRLTWPRIEAVPRPSASRARGLALAGQRFLVVEDDPAVTLLLEAALESRGAEVCVVRSHAELNGALSEPHDGAIVDLSPLAGHVSEAFAKVAAAARAGAPLVLATGSVDALPEEVTRLSVAVRLVRKPFELGEVLAALTSGKGQNTGQL